MSPPTLPPPARLEGVQCSTGEERRMITNSSGKNKVETMLSCGCVWWYKVRSCKKQYCIETWNIRSTECDQAAYGKSEHQQPRNQ